jgi:hypothetical protein
LSALIFARSHATGEESVLIAAAAISQSRIEQLLLRTNNRLNVKKVSVNFLP